MGQVIRVDFGKPRVQIKRQRKCSHSSVVVDEQQGVVYCSICKDEVDPVKALIGFVRNVTPILDRLRSAMQESGAKEPSRTRVRRSGRYAR